MDTYICLLFDGDDAIIRSTTIVMATNGGDVRARARALLEETPGACGFELWLDGDRVYAYFPDRNKTASQ